MSKSVIDLLRKDKRVLEQGVDFLTNWKISAEQIRLEEKVASGAEGEVWSGFLEGHSYRDQVAIKKALPNPETLGEERKAPVWDEREVNFLIKMSHPHLVKFVGAGEIYDPRFGQQVLFIVQEFATGGSINNALWNTPLDSLSWDTRLQWANDIADGMGFIHDRGYTHRDLKSPNVLYDTDTMRCKVADFGMSILIDDDDSSSRSRSSNSDLTTSLLSDMAAAPIRNKHMTAQCGTPEWMAPELAKVSLDVKKKYRGVDTHTEAKSRQAALQSFYAFQKKCHQVQYSRMVDVYAYAITMFELASHEPPWLESEGDQDAVFQMVVAGIRPALDVGIKATAPSGWCSLMEQCWHPEPDRRPDFGTISKKLAKMRQTGGVQSFVESYEVRVLSPRRKITQPWDSDSEYTPMGHSLDNDAL